MILAHKWKQAAGYHFIVCVDNQHSLQELQDSIQKELASI
jgi:hypothetical protein